MLVGRPRRLDILFACSKPHIGVIGAASVFVHRVVMRRTVPPSAFPMSPKADTLGTERDGSS
jgi:hypothetical protein